MVVRPNSTIEQECPYVAAPSPWLHVRRLDWRLLTTSARLASPPMQAYAISAYVYSDRRDMSDYPVAAENFSRAVFRSRSDQKRTA